MPDDNENLAKGSGTAADQVGKLADKKKAEAPPAEEEHYEEVAEYRIGEGPPPIALIVMFFMIVAWATLSWIPFFGY